MPADPPDAAPLSGAQAAEAGEQLRLTSAQRRPPLSPDDFPEHYTPDQGDLERPTAGSRVAGGLLLIEVALGVLVAVAAMRRGVPIWPPKGIVFEFLVGCALLTGHPKGRNAGLAWMVLGTLYYGTLSALDGQFTLLAVRFWLAVCLGLLLVGTPRPARIVAATGMALFCLLAVTARLMTAS
jgi:hypothetical protein